MASKTRGGKREGAGRKADPLTGNLIKINARVTQEQLDTILQVGGGNLSAGIRKLATEHKQASNNAL